MLKKTIVRGLLAAALAATMLGGAAMADASLPEGLPPGSQYQILFVTSGGTTASSSNIATYNSFVTQEADQSPTLAALGATWTAVASTATFSASSAYTTTNAPVYDTQGHLLEPNYGSLFTDDNCLGPSFTQTGVEEEDYVWTGYWLPNGTLGSNYPGHTLGTSDPIVGFNYEYLPDKPQAWLCQDDTGKNAQEPLYAISSPITVVPEPSTLALLIAGAVGLIGVVSRRRMPASLFA